MRISNRCLGNYLSLSPPPVFSVAATDPALHFVLFFFRYSCGLVGSYLAPCNPLKAQKSSFERSSISSEEPALFVHVFGGKYAILCLQVFDVSDLFDSQVVVWINLWLT
jgi:hypothetical protein